MFEPTQVCKAGMTPVEATAFLQGEFPEIPHWTYVHAEHSAEFHGLAKMARQGYQSSGQAGKWKWTRLASRYPRTAFWPGHQERADISCLWTGALQVTGPDGRTFIVFSYLSHRDKFCMQYLFSTDDTKLIGDFVADLARLYRSRRHKNPEITVMNGPDFTIPMETRETVFLPEGLDADIETQVTAFFAQKALFKKLGARYQRGFLFLGPPGTGKTLTIRRIVRMCHRRFKVRFFSLNITRKTDEDDLMMLFSAAQHSAPAVIILDDMDSLTRETAVTRSVLLSLLDGLNTNKGILIIGSSNNPGDIDPALLQRPSRFDRVWLFPVPDPGLREKYLKHHIPGMPGGLIEELVRGTGDWSYAYLNELRMTAQIMALHKGRPALDPEVILDAYHLLAEQFDSGKKGFVSSSTEARAGFGVAAGLERPHRVAWSRGEGNKENL